MSGGDVCGFSSTEYWNSRYRDGKPAYDWYFGYTPYVKNVFQRLIRSFDAKILNIGCGNSVLSGSLYKDGKKNIWNIDFSKVAIDSMTRTYRDCKEMHWIVGDVRTLGEYYQDEFFDLAFDKGTFDTLLCSSNVEKNISSLLSGVFTILKSGGKFLIFSHKPLLDKHPHYIDRDQWNVVKAVVDKQKPSKAKAQATGVAESRDNFSFYCPVVYYLYILTKKGEGDVDSGEGELGETLGETTGDLQKKSSHHSETKEKEVNEGKYKDKNEDRDAIDAEGNDDDNNARGNDRDKKSDLDDD